MQGRFWMKLVSDANAFISALLRPGLTRKVWVCPEVFLCAPSYLLIELREHGAELAGKYKGSAGEFEQLESKLLSYVKLVSDADLKPYLSAASSLSSDQDDWLYLACALRENAAIWTQDGGFTGQKRVKILTTAELAKEVGLL